MRCLSYVCLSQHLPTPATLVPDGAVRAGARSSGNVSGNVHPSASGVAADSVKRAHLGENPLMGARLAKAGVSEEAALAAQDMPHSLHHTRIEHDSSAPYLGAGGTSGSMARTPGAQLAFASFACLMLQICCNLQKVSASCALWAPTMIRGGASAVMDPVSAQAAAKPTVTDVGAGSSLKEQTEPLLPSGKKSSPATGHVPDSVLGQGQGQGYGGKSLLDESDKGKLGGAAGGLGTGALLKEHADASKEQARARKHPMLGLRV